jgi:ParB/RepB/Spo0J family partition protein
LWGVDISLDKVVEAFDSSSAEEISLPIMEVIPDALQPRQSYDVAALEQLAGSIREFGILNKPLVERMTIKRAIEYVQTWDDSKHKQTYLDFLKETKNEFVYMLVSGHRRHLAGLMAGLNNLNCLVIPGDLSIIERRIIQLHENKYTPLSPWMRAEAIVDLFGLISASYEEKRMTYTRKQLALDIGYSESTISDAFAFVEDLHEEIKERVREEKVEYGHAINISRLPKQRQQGELRQILDAKRGKKKKGMSLREATKRVSGLLRQEREVFVPQTAYETTAWEHKLPKLRESLKQCQDIMYIVIKLSNLSGSEVLREYNTFLTSSLIAQIKAFYTDFSEMTGPASHLHHHFSSYHAFADYVKNIAPRPRAREKIQTERYGNLVSSCLEKNLENRLDTDPEPLYDHVRMIPLDEIDFDPKNPRKKYKSEDIEELAASIAKVGLIHPIHVTYEDGKYRVDAGNSRLRAYHLLDEKGLLKERVIPAYILNELPENLLHRLKIDENTQQRPNLDERAATWSGLFKDMKTGGNLKTIAAFSREIGEPADVVGTALKYEDSLHPDVQNLVHEGILPYSVALVLAEYNNQFVDSPSASYTHEQLEWQIIPALDAALGNYSSVALRNSLDRTIQDRLQTTFLSEREIRDFREQVRDSVRSRLNSALQGLSYLIREEMKPEHLPHLMNNISLLRAFYKFDDTISYFFRQSMGDLVDK